MSNSFNIELGIKLIQLRTRLGKSKVQVSKETGIDRTALGYLEDGSRLPSLSTFIDLINYYNVSGDYLIGLNIKSSRMTPIGNQIGVLISKEDEKNQLIIKEVVMNILKVLHFEIGVQ